MLRCASHPPLDSGAERHAFQHSGGLSWQWKPCLMTATSLIGWCNHPQPPLAILPQCTPHSFEARAILARTWPSQFRFSETVENGTRDLSAWAVPKLSTSTAICFLIQQLALASQALPLQPKQSANCHKYRSGPCFIFHCSAAFLTTFSLRRSLVKGLPTGKALSRGRHMHA